MFHVLPAPFSFSLLNNTHQIFSCQLPSSDGIQIHKCILYLPRKLSFIPYTILYIRLLILACNRLVMKWNTKIDEYEISGTAKNTFTCRHAIIRVTKRNAPNIGLT